MWSCDRIRAIIVQRRLDDGDQDAGYTLRYKTSQVPKSSHSAHDF